MRSICTAILLSICVTPAFAKEWKVEVEAGETDRFNTPVSVELPGKLDELPRRAIVFCDDSRTVGQLVIDDDKARLYWIIDEMRAGSTKKFRIIPDVIKPLRAEVPEFHWEESSNEKRKSTDLLLDDRKTLRYFYTPFDPDNIEDTKKPFHMVYSPDGKQLLTKGLGGLFPHHRGIFFGYNKCRVGDEVYDVWHAAKGEHQLHKAFLDKAVGPVLGSHTSRILWNDRQGKPFADEKRTLTVYRQPADQLLIEFNATLQATDGKVILEGDRQHAGVQWRSAQEVAENQKKTRYLRPAKWADLPPEQQINTEAHRDLPWNAIQYPLGKSEYTVAYLTSPKNPDNAAFSERLYGRFGEYFPCELEPGKPLVVRYRWWVIATHDVKRDQIELKYADLSNPPEVKLVSAPEK